MAMEQHLFRGGSEADFEDPDWWSTVTPSEIDSDSDSGDEWGYDSEDDGWDIVSFPSHDGLARCAMPALIAHLCMSTVIATFRVPRGVGRQCRNQFVWHLLSSYSHRSKAPAPSCITSCLPSVVRHRPSAPITTRAGMPRTPCSWLRRSFSARCAKSSPSHSP